LLAAHQASALYPVISYYERLRDRTTTQAQKLTKPKPVAGTERS
jgi:hypothetical protein